MNKSVKPKRSLSESVKKRIAGTQHYKCANEKSDLEGLEGYDCPLWQIPGSHQGIFNESGYGIDHKTEFCITADDSEENLQALCGMCHSVKSKRFATNRAKDNRSKQINTNFDSDSEDSFDGPDEVYISDGVYAKRGSHLYDLFCP